MMWNEDRPGAVLADPVLALFGPRDFSAVTFGLIYAAMLATVLGLLRRPARLLLVFQGYAVVAFVRIVVMYCIPLDPPETIIPLRDPLVEIVGTGRVLTRDLFFSGHTATLFLFFLALPRGWLRGAVLVACVLVAALTVWQHTHYVVDVLVAPFVSFAAWRLVSAVSAREERIAR
jgi:membrane-associated phospholipid phosphatase